ncbi:helicase-related protein, partial [Thiolapillus sp.]|uniref:helicase-related protein n=1 Tax=Thiolapillus sp. TaxID=2017437 RepID=UPI003AF8E349
MDRPIIDQSQGKLRWIVIDEAHSYLGSQAAELTLLLRRVLLAFGCQPDQVHFIATSATIGSGEGAKHQLQKFLADIAGVDPSRVTVVTGEREIPELRSEFSGQHLPLPQPSTLQQMTPDERYGALASCPQIRQMRKRLAASAARLTDLMSILKWKESPQDRLNLLALLDLCASARHGENGPLLPLRGHFFQRGQPGLWACSNAQCEGRVGTCLDAAEWPFGAVFTDRREHCSYCGYPVFELYQCGDCGEEVLAATQVYESAEDWLHPLNITEDVDEFQLDIEDLPAEEETENETEASAPSIGLRRLVVAGGSGQSNDTLSPDGLLGATGDEVISVSLQLPGESGRLQCPRCGGEERRSLSMSLFRPVRIGAPFLLQTAIPELLKHLPSKQTRSSDNPLPLQGRNLLAFTDSRQGTARIAARLQQESERNYVRSLLYHKLGELAESTDGRDVKKLKKQVKELEGVSQGNPVFQQLLEETKKKLADKQSPQIALLSWNESVDFLMGDRGFNRFVIPPLRDLTLELTDRQVTELCLWREFLFRPRNQFSLEGMGLVRLNYPELDNIAEAPAALRHLGVNVEEWRDFLQVVLDIIVRGWKAVSIPRDMLRWTGYLGVASDILPPGQPRTGWDQHGWPSAKNTMGRRSRLIRLITYAFQWDPANEIHQELIEEIINAIWIALKPLLSASEGGTYYLDLPRKAQLSGVHDAWLCPVTRRLLPITFKGLTPYLPLTATDELAKCERVEMPRLPAPFWPESEEKAREWLETDEKVRKLRSMGAWSDLNDRIAGFSPYFRSVEHSAQIKGNLLTRREKEFKEGRINLLSCSTTMEMGVDIGGLSAVAMNNVPPHPANFLQRAGRAGRRGEKSALSFTLCKSTPQGEAVFNNPLWAFTTALSVPQVALQSGRIIQRHVNALSLTQFLVQNT